MLNAFIAMIVSNLPFLFEMIQKNIDFIRTYANRILFFLYSFEHSIIK